MIGVQIDASAGGIFARRHFPFCVELFRSCFSDQSPTSEFIGNLESRQWNVFSSSGGRPRYGGKLLRSPFEKEFIDETVGRAMENGFYIDLASADRHQMHTSNPLR
jgi:hypothetical protein